jgi:hypothetical protein
MREAMKTLSHGFIPMLPQDDTEYEFLLDWLEFAMSKQQLRDIKHLWNNGSDISEIVTETQRKPLEILMALIHLSEKNHKIRAMGRLF